MGIAFQNILRTQIVLPALFTDRPTSQWYGLRSVMGVQIMYSYTYSFNWMLFFFVTDGDFTPENFTDIVAVMDDVGENQKTEKIATNIILTILLVIMTISFFSNKKQVGPKPSPI